MGLKKKITQFWETVVDMKMCYEFYYDKIKELSISVFEWQNLPEEIDVRFLELNLFERGCAVFFYDDVVEEYMCLPTAYMGKWNIYNIPILRDAFASNGYNRHLDIDNSVIIYNNVLRTPSIRDTKMFAKRLANFDITVDINVDAQKTPVLIRCDEKEQLSLENLYMKYKGGQPVIFGDRGLSAKPLDVLKTDAPYVADKIYDLKTKYWNEMLTFRGISNININKKERLITDEVARSQGGTIASRYSGLMMRQQACEKINRMFGLDIWCEFRDNLDGLELTDQEPDQDPEGGAADE